MMPQLCEAGALFLRLLEAMTGSYKVPTYEEGEAESHACYSSNLTGKLMRLVQYRQVGEAEGGKICNLTV